jgi:hypothetical protein
MLSRLTVLFALFLTAPTLSAQTALWSRVSHSYKPPRMPRVELTREELTAVRNLLRSPGPKDVWGCDDVDWINDASFSNIALATGHRTVLVDSGSSCAPRGTGGGGPMWIVELHGSRASVLASQKQNFSGWLFSIQPNPHSAYRDIVLGWHMSAYESDLTYFRFDDRSYRRIGSAVLKYDRDGGDGKGTLIPNPPAPSTR